MEIIFDTERCFLREPSVDDAYLAYILNLDPAVIKYTGDLPFSSVDEARIFLENYNAFEKYGMGRWYAFLKENNEFVGWCGLKFSPDINEVDVGYRLLKKYWNLGLATELAAASIYYGFNELGIEEIVARAMNENIASVRVMEKIGMDFHSKISFDGIPGVLYKAKEETWVKP